MTRLSDLIRERTTDSQERGTFVSRAESPLRTLIALGVSRKTGALEDQRGGSGK